MILFALSAPDVEPSSRMTLGSFAECVVQAERGPQSFRRASRSALSTVVNG